MKTFFAVIAGTTMLAFARADEFVRPRQLGGRGRGGGKGGGRGGGSDSSSPDEDSCSDPAGAVLDLLVCFEVGDVDCITGAYTSGFETYHNEVLATADYSFDDPVYWTNAVLSTNETFNVQFSSNPSPNLASVRYIQTVSTIEDASIGLVGYPYGQNVTQYEHALVTVDDDCKMVKWDQYGDNQEQIDADELLTALGDALATLACSLDPSQCA